MAEWKWEYHAYDVTECDEFAQYLESMARQGWHFKEWKNRLGFEKGAPEESVYDVQIFSKTRVNDLKAEGETLVFSDYCEAAGWKLVDSKGKLCIFKRLQDDAVPIVTAEEKISNVNMAFLKTIWLPLIFTFEAVFRIWCTYTDPASNLFDNFSLFATVLTVLMMLYLWIGFFYKWRNKKKAELQYKETGELFFGHKNPAEKKLIAGYPAVTFAGIIFVFIAVLALSALWGGKSIFFFMVIVLTIFLVFSFKIQNTRPERNERILSTGFMIIAFVGFMLVFIIWNIFSSDSESIPSKSVFGYCKEYDDQKALPDSYATRYHFNSWVPENIKDRVWTCMERDELKNMDSSLDCLKWHAKDSSFNGDSMTLRYQNDFLTVWDEEKVTQQQADDFVAQEKLQ